MSFDRSLRGDAPTVRHVSRRRWGDDASMGKGLSSSLPRLQHMASMPEFRECVGVDQREADAWAAGGSRRTGESQVASLARRDDFGFASLNLQTI